MALKKAVIFKSLQIPGSYFRVVRPQIDATKSTMSFDVWAYPSQDAASDQTNLLSDICAHYSAAPYTIAGSNPFEQAYAHLKTLPGFEDATDVLEVGQTA